MKRIIDRKSVDLTDDEWNLYQALCESYTRPNFDGKNMFEGLLVTNDDGIIINVLPPTKNYSSMEIYLFCVSVMHNQHLRLMHEQVTTFCREAKDHLSILMEEVRNLVKEQKKNNE